jgi:hypothetical protein
MLPRYIKKYFWDIDTYVLNLKKYKKYVIERILEMGDEKAVFWMKNFFSSRDIRDVIKESKRLSPLSLNYWRLVFKKK